MKIALFTILAMLCSIGHAAVTPGPDCGAGATVVGTKDAGKVTIGSSPDQNTCTLTGFSWSKVPSCSATLETIPQPYATISGKTTLVLVYPLFALDDMQTGYVVSYLCVGQ